VDLTLVEVSHEEAVARLEQGQADLAVLAGHPIRQTAGRSRR
jgi:hypothetical protein